MTTPATRRTIENRILITAGGFIAVVLALGFIPGLARNATGIAGLAAAAVIYLIPGLTARARKVPNVGSVWVVNVLAGWTVIGWIVAMAMAMRDPQPQ